MTARSREDLRLLFESGDRILQTSLWDLIDSFLLIDENLAVKGEIPSGTVNGVNATFFTAHEFVPELLEVYLNGLLQHIVIDYQTVGNQQINFTFSPLTGELIKVSYIRA